MLEPLSEPLKKVARGTGIAMVGMFFGLLFQFAAKVIIARYFLQADYGVFSMALVILNFAMVLVCLGLVQGAAVYIAYFRAKKEAAKIRGTIRVSLTSTTASSIIIGMALFLSAEAIAVNVFHTPDLVPALRIFAIGLPFFVLINILAAIFRGFDRAEPGAYFQSILLNILFLLLLVIPILVGQSFIAVLYTYLAALILTFVALVIYSGKKLPQLTEFTGNKADASVWRELLIFSLPLMGSAIFSMVISWTDTLMLGYFKMPEIVGLYNAASPLAYFITMPMAALVLIYTPVTASLYSQNRMAELRRNYTILTKWLATLTLPLFLVLFLFPEAVLNIFFGSAYIAAAPALRILSAGFIVANLFGPNGGALLAMGESRFIMWSVLVPAIVNVPLNIVLIPPLGIVGAATASAVSLTLSYIMASLKLYKLCRAQPLSKNLIKPIVASIVLAVLFRFLLGGLTPTWWMLTLLFVLYYAVYGIAIVLTRSFDPEDIALLLEIEKRSGINAAPIKKVLRRFVSL
jgi:O-antigen/teichoic acid export membrane protein